MKYKLSHIQFMALHNLFQEYVVPLDQRVKILPDMRLKMYSVIMLQIWKRLYSKAVEKKTTYSLKLEEHEEMAFWLYWQDMPLPKSLEYESHLIQTMCNSIHQKYC